MRMNYLSRVLALAVSSVTLVSGLSASSGFECEYCVKANQPIRCMDETESFTVVRLGAGGLSSVDVSSPANPFVGLARRYEKAGTAVEVSANWSSNEEKQHCASEYYSIPRILYIQYSQPRDSSSFFYGAGLSWGGIEDKVENMKFRGILGDVALGYEMQRDSSVRAIVQLDIAQPLIASKMRGELPPANIVMTLGIGF